MSYYGRGARDSVDDFDEYDPTPYGGGYDLALTYGPPMPPSEETCYTASCSSSDAQIDYDRPQYSSYSHTSFAAYGDDYSKEDRYGVAHAYSSPKPDYEFQPGGGMNYGSSEGGSGFGGSYGGRPKREEEEEEGYGFGSDRPGRYGDDFARPPPKQEQSYGFDSDRPPRYGDDDDGDNSRRHRYGEEDNPPPPPPRRYQEEGGYGGDYPPPRRQQEEEGYGGDYPPPRRHQEEEGYGGDYPPPRRHQEEEGYGGDYPPPRRHQEEEGYGGDYPPPRRHQEEESYAYQGSQEYGYGGGGRPSYQQQGEDEPRKYRIPSYDPDQGEEFSSPKSVSASLPLSLCFLCTINLYNCLSSSIFPCNCFNKRIV